MNGEGLRGSIDGARNAPDLLNGAHWKRSPVMDSPVMVSGETCTQPVQAASMGKEARMETAVQAGTYL